MNSGLFIRSIILKLTWHFRMRFVTQITSFAAGARHVQSILLAFSIFGENITTDVFVHTIADRICEKNIVNKSQEQIDNDVFKKSFLCCDE